MNNKNSQHSFEKNPQRPNFNIVGHIVSLGETDKYCSCKLLVNWYFNEQHADIFIFHYHPPSESPLPSICWNRTWIMLTPITHGNQYYVLRISSPILNIWGQPRNQLLHSLLIHFSHASSPSAGLEGALLTEWRWLKEWLYPDRWQGSRYRLAGAVNILFSFKIHTEGGIGGKRRR